VSDPQKIIDWSAFFEVTLRKQLPPWDVTGKIHLKGESAMDTEFLFEASSKRRKGFPSEARVKRGFPSGSL
jgi:hypothetical protein